MGHIISESKFKEIYDKALELLGTFGVEFDSPRVLKIFSDNGFIIKDKRVFFTAEQIDAALALMPKADYSDLSQKKVVGSNIFGTVPVIFDDEKKIHRRGDMTDIINEWTSASKGTHCHHNQSRKCPREPANPLHARCPTPSEHGNPPCIREQWDGTDRAGARERTGR